MASGTIIVHDFDESETIAQKTNPRELLIRKMSRDNLLNAVPDGSLLG